MYAWVTLPLSSRRLPLVILALLAHLETIPLLCFALYFASSLHPYFHNSCAELIDNQYAIPEPPLIDLIFP